MSNDFNRNADAWIERAAASCGLTPRGVESLRPGLEIFLDEYARSTLPSATGRAMAEFFLVEVLSARFRIEDWICRHPAVLDKPVARPVFILGMPRAGTTSLFNMLAHDPQRRFYWNWENNREVPPAHIDHMHDDPRIARRVAEVNGALEQGLLDHRQHVEMGDQPAECIMLMAQDFKSMLWSTRTPLPGYFEWMLNTADMDAAYRHHKRALQVMQSEAPGKWTLKLPNHAQAIDSILRVYPDARIVMTHRDPVKTVGSSCDAERFFVAQGTPDLDARIIGTQTVRLLTTEMARLTAARERHPEVPFYDFHFRRFIADPIDEVRRLYAFLGDDLAPEIEQAMRDELRTAELIRKEMGGHHYELETFGLSQKELLSLFEDYIRRYDVEIETNY